MMYSLGLLGCSVPVKGNNVAYQPRQVIYIRLKVLVVYIVVHSVELPAYDRLLLAFMGCVDCRTAVGRVQGQLASIQALFLVPMHRRCKFTWRLTFFTASLLFSYFSGRVVRRSKSPAYSILVSHCKAVALQDLFWQA